jgi:hypothetical protein
MIPVYRRLMRPVFLARLPEPPGRERTKEFSCQDRHNETVELHVRPAFVIAWKTALAHGPLGSCFLVESLENQIVFEFLANGLRNPEGFV